MCDEEKEYFINRKSAICYFLVTIAVLFLIVYFLNDLDISKTKEYIKNPILFLPIGGMICIFIFFMFKPQLASIIFYRFLQKRVGDQIGENTDHKAEWKEIKEIKKKPDNVLFVKNNNTDEMKELEHKIRQLVSDKKYDVAINKINAIEKERKFPQIFMCVLKDIVYLNFPEKQDINLRINNLKDIIKLAEPKYPEILFEAYIHLIECHYDDQDYKGALEYSNICLKKFNNSKILNNKDKNYIFYLMGNIHIKLGKKALAINYYKKASDYTEDDDLINYNIALIYAFGLSNFDKALEYLNKLMFRIKDNTELEISIINVYAYCQAFLGYFQDAYNAIDNCIKTHDEISNKDLMMLLAKKSYIAYKLGSKEESRNIAENVLKNNPKDDTCINVLSMLSLDSRNYEKVITFTSSIIDNFMKYENNDVASNYYLAEICYHRGIAYLETNQIEKACKDFKRAIDLNFDEINVEYLSRVNIDYEATK